MNRLGIRSRLIYGLGSWITFPNYFVLLYLVGVSGVSYVDDTPFFIAGNPIYSFDWMRIFNLHEHVLTVKPRPCPTPLLTCSDEKALENRALFSSS